MDEWPDDRNHDVEILISGECGAGKTTLAQLIKRRVLSTLAEAGIRTEVIDPDGPIDDEMFALLIDRLAARSLRQPYPLVRVITFQKQRRAWRRSPRVSIAEWVDEELPGYPTVHAVHLQLTKEGALFSSTDEAREFARDVLRTCDDLDSLEGR